MIGKDNFNDKMCTDKKFNEPQNLETLQKLLRIKFLYENSPDWPDFKNNIIDDNIFQEDNTEFDHIV